jgi:hypothetical protein
MEVKLGAFLTLALDGGEWSASHPGRFTPREIIPFSLRIGGWKGPSDYLDDVKKRKSLVHTVFF